MAQVPAPLARLGQRIREFTLAQRTIAIIGIAVLVLGGFALSTAMSQPRMAPLYSGLDPADASAIVEQLRAEGVPYELTAGGTSVMVPEAQVYDARLNAAADGLPNATRGGYSLLDDMGVTSSEFQQSITYKRALEGELAGTIEAIDAVEQASVTLAIPEETVFVDSQQDPTASIFVQQAPGASFGEDQIQSVVHLVASAVDGLKPENVSLVDAEGQLLSAVGVGAVGGGSQQASDYEERVGTAVQTMLDRVVGRGNATVAVAAELSMESAERLEEVFEEPDEAPALSESTSTEEYTGTGGGNAGVLGPDNIAVPEGQGGEGTYSAEQTDRSNAVNKVTENRSIPAGELTTQSVSVAVDQAAAAGLNVADLTTMVSDAAGIDEDRGDQVSVAVVPFSTAEADAAAEALAEAAAAEEAERRAAWLQTMAIGGAAVLLLLVALTIILFLRRGRRSRELVDLGEPFPAGELTAGGMAALEATDDAGERVLESVGDYATATIPRVRATAPASAATPASALDGWDPNEQARSKRAELNALASQDPQRVAEHLRSLMEEGSRV
ncbi:flagellar basal-body MS-ring/collar protein FliF [Nesterenkonia sandarakina]|uniref:Flagellar M-ring protein n=1 Tax=Nesterenkonia sandarakina TaxID=272918 RepID=A0A7Z0E9N2_9MICC|nr:flagellar basal-body MS-ring/collar protein FliF [Nesterenkonia sandarakina]NYJ16892.1 flagellar M-ring protein FliF [Nesterenkonia sandarakina]